MIWRRIKKTVIYVITGALILTFIALVSTQTRWFKDWLRNIVVAEVSNVVEGEFSVGRIGGNLFTSLELTNVLLLQQGDTVLYVNRVSAEYSPRRLLSGVIQVDRVHVDSLFGRLWQLEDSSWNAAHLVIPDSTSPPTEPQTPSEPLDWEIVLNELQILDSRLHFNALDSLPLRDVQNINVSLNGSYSSQRIELAMTEMNLRAVDPDFTLEQLTFNAVLDSSTVNVTGLAIHSANNRLKGNVEFQWGENWSGLLELQTEPLAPGEFGPLADILYQVQARPTVGLRATLLDDSLNADLQLRDSDQAIRLSTRLTNFSSLLDSAEVVPNYAADLEFGEVRADHWTGDSTLDLLINGMAHIEGTGTTEEDFDIHWLADFTDCVILQHPLQTCLTTGEYGSGRIAGEFDLKGPFGEADIKGWVYDPIGKQDYVLTAKLNHVNLAVVLLDSTLESDISLDVAAKGSGFDPEDGQGSVRFSLDTSEILGINFDSAHIEAALESRNLIVDTLLIISSGAHLAAKGHISEFKAVDMQFEAFLDDMSLLKEYLETDSISVDGKLSGHARGTVDSLDLHASWMLGDLIYNEYVVSQFEGSCGATYVADTVRDGELDLSVRGVTADGFSADSLIVDGTFGLRSASIRLLAAVQQDLWTKIETEIDVDSSIYIGIPHVETSLFDHRLAGGSPTMGVCIGDSTIIVRDFELIGPKGEFEAEAHIKVDGSFNMSGPQDLNLSVAGLELQRIASITKYPIRSDGELSLDFIMAGTNAEPSFALQAALVDGHVRQRTFDSLTLKMAYLDDSLGFEVMLYPNPHNLFALQGHLPLSLALSDSMGFVSDLHENRPFQVQLRADSIPLTHFLGHMQTFDQIEGKLTCDLRLQNTPADPDADGFLQLEDGSLSSELYGMKLDTLAFKFVADGSRLVVDQFTARRDGGSLDMPGFVQLSDSLLHGVIEDFNFTLTANDFYVLKHRNYDIQIDSDVEFKAVDGQPTYVGEIEVLRSSLYLPALGVESGVGASETDATMPMLARATNRPPPYADSLNGDSAAWSFRDSEFYKRLQGRLKLKMRRNSWIKGKDGRLELDGDLDIVKNGPNIVLFNELKVIRGQIALLGRRFQIKEEGVLTFRGEDPPNPILLLRAEYEFRSDRTSRKLEVIIEGTAEEPTLRFTLDDKEIEFADAISYIIFGASSDDLSSGQQSGVHTVIAMDMASSLASAQLSNSLGEQLNLDYIEVSAKDSWQSATFMVGKYVTNQLFVSYEREFGESRDNDIAAETITAEWELTRVVSFRLVSGNSRERGVDLLLRYEID